MTPELTILIINAVFMAFAYLWAYPSLPEKTLSAILVRDTAISLSALGIAGMLFWGSGISFSLVLFDVNWLVFAILSLSAMEIPLFLWFAKKHGLRLDDLE